MNTYLQIQGVTEKSFLSCMGQTVQERLIQNKSGLLLIEKQCSFYKTVKYGFHAVKTYFSKTFNKNWSLKFNILKPEWHPSCSLDSILWMTMLGKS